jgi:hypothetical protein
MTVPIINVNNSSLVEESVYAKRLRNYYSKDYLQSLGNNHDSIWNNRKRLDGYAQMKTTHFSIQEEEYKGHQIVVIGYHQEFQYYLTRNTLEHVDEHSQLGTAILETQVHKFSHYIAFGYKIGDISSAIDDLNFSYQYAVVKGTFETDSFDATMKKAKKRIDLQSKIVAVSNELIAIASERWNGGFTHQSEFTPYNALVGDQVFIQAHGRLRKGIVVDTTGSRFIVGYVTPSNHNELKFKTLRLSELYAQEKV